MAPVLQIAVNAYVDHSPLLHKCLIHSTQLTHEPSNDLNLLNLFPFQTLPLYFATGSMANAQVIEVTANDNHCAFLSMPPEIRNAIYRCILVEGDIEMDPQPSIRKPPPLLQTNSQVRKEAIDIYYLENNMLWSIKDFNIGWTMRWAKVYNREIIGQSVVTGDLVWANLVAWLKAFAKGEAHGLDPEIDLSQRRYTVVGQMFELVRQGLENGLKWNRIKASVECMRVALSVYDDVWEADA